MSGLGAQSRSGSTGWTRQLLTRTLNHSVIYGLSVGLLPLTNLLLLPVYTRALSPEGFGLLSLLMVTSGVLSFLYDLGLINALFRRYFDHPVERTHARRVVLSTAWFFQGMHAIIWTALLSVAAPGVGSIGGQGNICRVVRLMLASTLLTALSDVPASILRIRGRAGAFGLVAFVRGAFLVGVTWWLVGVQRRGLAGVFESQLVVGTVALCVLVAMTINEYALEVSWRECLAMLKFGLPFFPVLLLTWVIDFSDRYFLGLFATLREVGIYTVAYKMGQIVLLAVKAFSVAWIPLMFSVARESRAPGAFATVFRYYALGLSVLGLLVSLFAPELVALFATPGYQAGAGVIPLIVVAHVLYGVYSFMLSGLLATKDVWVQPLTLSASALLNVLLNWWWIPVAGIWGAAWATVLSYGLAAVGTWYVAQRRYPIPIEPRPLLLLCIGALGLFALSRWWALSGFWKAAVLLAYGLMLYRGHFFEPAELAQLKRTLTRRCSTAADPALVAE